MPTTPRRAIPRSATDTYRLFVRTRNKVFSMAAGPSFHTFGHASVIHLPIKLHGEERIAVGSNVMIGPDCWLESAGTGMIELASGTRLTGRVTIVAHSQIRLGKDALLARGVYVSDVSHKRSDPNVSIRVQGTTDARPVQIGEGAWLGQNAVILPGVRIGRMAVVGANSVVNEDVPDYAVAVGAPARVVSRTGPV